ncbi:MAG: NAD(P)H-binding protein [Myxococcales bacterium]|nr:NAD(P)H-binding protein [Myxococcales bacterium]
MSRWVVIGAGYTGARLVAALTERGDDVVATRRSAEPPARAVDLAEPTTLAGLFAPGDVVVVTAPPIDERGTGERALAAAAAAAGVARIVYVSSTGVYAAAGGAWVDEAFTIAPITRSGVARVAAEAAIAGTAVPATVARPPGIYGPGRGVVARLRAGGYRVIGEGRAHVSRVHVDDLVAALIAIGDAASPAAVYNVADDDPCPSAEIADAAAAALGLPPPPRVPPAAVDAEVVGMLAADRRVDAGRLKRDLGWTPRYPSWRTALAAELRAG